MDFRVEDVDPRVSARVTELTSSLKQIVGAMEAIVKRAGEKALSAEDQLLYDSLKAHYEKTKAERDEEGQKVTPAAARYQPLGTESGVTSSDQQQIKLLTKKDRVVDAIRSSVCQSENNLSLVRALRGMVLGDWSGVKKEFAAQPCSLAISVR